jgi:hypothetical protein
MKKTTEESEELALENIRYFAEASDRVDCIDVYADLHGDLGMINSNIVERLRDDYGTTVAIPIWLLDHHKIQSYPINFKRLAPQKTLQLFHHATILNYASLLDYTNMIVPVQIPMEESVPSPAPSTNEDAHMFQYRLSGAIALETALSYRCNQVLSRSSNFRDGNTINSNVQSTSTKEWIHGTTAGNRLPICMMEAFLPAITHGYTDGSEEFMLKSLEVLKDSDHRKDERSNNSNNNKNSNNNGNGGSGKIKELSFDVNLFHFNPFMTSFGLSSFNNLKRKPGHDMRRYEKPLTNSLLFRGFGSSGESFRFLFIFFNHFFLF